MPSASTPAACHTPARQSGPAVSAISCCTSDGASAAEFAALVHAWEQLRLEPSTTRRKIEAGSAYVLALLRTRCAPSTVARLEARMRVLSAPGPSIEGRALAGLAELPPRRRGQLISQLHVLCRLRGEAPELRTAEQLERYLERCGGVLPKLRAEWRGEEQGATCECRRPSHQLGLK